MNGGGKKASQVAIRLRRSLQMLILRRDDAKHLQLWGSGSRTHYEYPILVFERVLGQLLSNVRSL